MTIHSTGTTTSARLQFATALSRKTDTEAATRDLADAVRMQIGTAPIDLAFVFFSAHHAAKASMISAMLQGELQAKACIGCSGEGVIAGSEEIETAAALTIWVARLPHVRLTPLRLSMSQLQDQIRMPGWPEPGLEDSTFLLLADPFTTPTQEVLSLLTDRYPHSKAVGGLAGGGQDAGENRLVLNDQVFDGGLVGIQLSGPIAVRPVISQGCRPIGERFVVTRSEENLIYELGGVSALKRLQDVFESLGGAQRRDAHRALHLGIVIDEHRNHFERGDFLVRNLIGADQQAGAIAIGDIVQEGQTVQFHLRDAKSASDDLHFLLAADRTKHQSPPLGALLFSCCGRGEGLFGHPHHDSGVVQERLGPIPTAGFFAQGEIGPVGGRNFLHGYTASVVVFSEPDSRKEQP
ncbi:MAG: FIST C-terminal domain-containing protein [Nitrospirae bacterium]|nr:FIST C-terminal domain-containing protein [Nitrospirota bacterium]MDE3218616.1 FIST C-terminal domain-containing protein [Nitrospirota bacterium]